MASLWGLLLPAMLLAAAALGGGGPDEYLTPHNQARAAVGVPPLAWNATLASGASGIAAEQKQKSCGFADLSGSAYGANQGWASYRATPAEVVAAWVGEGKYYNHSSNTCAAAHRCGTYTQVVWRATAALGCAQATCSNGDTLTVCLYFPHGNIDGQSPY